MPSFRRFHAIALSGVALTVVTAGTLVGVSQQTPATVDATTGTIVTAAALAEAHEADTTTRSTDRESIEAAATARSASLSDQDAAITARETEVLLETRVEEQAAVTKSVDAEAERQTFIDENGFDPDITDPKEIARQMAANKFGWGDDQFTCYNNIIMRESKWDASADNPTSSAYGIPQALPGSRMASEGDDWRTNPATQIRWGLKYVQERYGNPCSAWSFKAAHGWY